MFCYTAISKKLKKLSGARVANKQIGKWTHAITNHLYKVVSESDPESVLRRDWWKSAANHACNIHDHQSDIFPACKHGPREEEKLGEDGDTYVRDWIDPGNDSVHKKHVHTQFLDVSYKLIINIEMSPQSVTSYARKHTTPICYATVAALTQDIVPDMQYFLIDYNYHHNGLV